MREASAQIGEGLTCASCVAVISARFNRFSSYKNYSGVILVAFWPKHGLRSHLRVPNFKFFPGEAVADLEI